MKNFTWKKIALTLLLTGFGLSGAFAQAYSKGDNLLNIGAGFGGGFGTPIGLSYEHGFSDKISGGVYASWSSKKENLGAWGSWKWSYILTAARASYHVDLGVDKLDPYVGVILGYNIASSSWTGTGASVPSASAGGVIYGGHAGARYFLSEKIGIFAEVGYGVGNLNAGLAFKL